MTKRERIEALEKEVAILNKEIMILKQKLVPPPTHSKAEYIINSLNTLKNGQDQFLVNSGEELYSS